MSFLKGLIDSFGSVFSDSSSSAPDSSAMDGLVGPGDASVTNERVAYKLKGYFDLAKEEIAKAVRAEEWGLVEDAVAHYNCAQRILAEASSIPVPSFISSSEQEKVKLYRQKISKWQGQVSDRLQVLSRRPGGTSINKKTIAPVRTTASTPTMSNSQNHVIPKTLHPSTSMPATRIQTNNIVRSEPVQDSGGGYDEKLVEMINSAIVDRSPSVKWEDVAGLEKVKKTLMEMVILPTKRRDLFTGLRRPARGLLLFGPPGNGKTMLAKAVASESEATFFNVSASSLTSKWVGEAEKLVRTLFMVASSRQPSVIFMDEIDSIMSTRQANENDASRRLKSEFLIQFDGVTSNPNDLVIVIGATNKPQELDDAVLRRLVKRVYIPLPDLTARRILLSHKLKGQAYSLPSGDLERLARDTEGKKDFPALLTQIELLVLPILFHSHGYSGSDLQALCEEAAMMPIRELGENILTIKANQLRALRLEDFQKSMTVIRPSLSKSKWEELEQWNEEFGSN